jgi:hypothetical protein
MRVLGRRTLAQRHAQLTHTPQRSLHPAPPIAPLPTSHTLCIAHAATVGAVLKPSPAVTAPIELGTATFTALSIDLAGDGYTLRCTTTLPLAGPMPTAKGAETTAALVLLSDPTNGGAAPLVSGEPFAVQPRVGVRDAGGNLLVEESDSAVLAAVVTGPPGLELRPGSRVRERRVNFKLKH